MYIGSNGEEYFEARKEVKWTVKMEGKMDESDAATSDKKLEHFEKKQNAKHKTGT